MRIGAPLEPASGNKGWVKVKRKGARSSLAQVVHPSAPPPMGPMPQSMSMHVKGATVGKVLSPLRHYTCFGLCFCPPASLVGTSSKDLVVGLLGNIFEKIESFMEADLVVMP